jgi:hypothetical protein
LVKYQKFQKSEPNLLLSEANLVMSEAMISANFNAFIIGFAIIHVRKIARVGQTHKKWTADSASMGHAPQIGLCESPIL